MNQLPKDHCAISAAPAIDRPAARLRRWLALAIFAAGCNGTVLCAQTGSPLAGGSTPLEPGKRIERELAGGQSHEYRFTLKADQYAKVLVEQTSIGVNIAVSAPDGKLLFEANSAANGSDATAELIGDSTGDYRVRVMSSDPTAPAGRYGITVGDIEAATEKHRRRIVARAHSPRG